MIFWKFKKSLKSGQTWDGGNKEINLLGLSYCYLINPKNWIKLPEFYITNNRRRRKGNSMSDGQQGTNYLKLFYFSNFVIVLQKEHKPTVASPFTNIIIFNFPKKRNYLVDATTIGSINDQMFIQKHK